METPKQNKSFSMPSFAGGAVPSAGRMPNTNALLEKVESEEQPLFPEPASPNDAVPADTPSEAPTEPATENGGIANESVPAPSEPASSQAPETPSAPANGPSDGGMFSD